jgi:16S rRNA pseudouridine516 synthase
MRLDRCLANSGYGSRSEVKNLIKRGGVCLAGQVVSDPGFEIEKNDFANVLVEGKAAQLHQNIHLMLNKPEGLITALADKKLPTIAEIIPKRWQNVGLFPVGRLDRDTTGLLLLTNDGTLGHRLTNPRWEIWKTYETVTRGKAFCAEDIQMFEQGLELPDGMHCQPAKLEIISENEARLIIQEGKYHQVKRMMLGTGRRVVKLHRSRIGPLFLDQDLLPGESRLLTQDEISSLYQSVELEPSY